MPRKTLKKYKPGLSLRDHEGIMALFLVGHGVGPLDSQQKNLGWKTVKSSRNPLLSKGFRETLDGLFWGKDEGEKNNKWYSKNASILLQLVEAKHLPKHVFFPKENVNETRWIFYQK